MVVSLDGEMSSPPPPPPADAPAPTEAPMADDTLSPCDLTKDMVGQDVTVTGQVEFVDQGSDGTFLELEGQGCRAGAFIMKSDWDSWSQDIKDSFEMGSSITVFARVGEFQGMLELQVIDLPIP